MKITTLITLTATAAASLVVSAFAHDGPRVWVAERNGTIVTETSDDDFDPTIYSPSQVFPAELAPYFGTYTTQFPGYEAPRDGSGNVSDSTPFGFKIAGPLLTLNASATQLVPTSTRFADQTAIPQLAITFPDAPPDQAAAYTRYTSSGVVAGYDLTNTISEHAHLAYTFLGDGNSATRSGPDGVFVLPMVLTSPSLTMSKWYFLAFRKGTVNDSAMSTALADAQTMATALPGDADFDGKVDFNDLLALARNYNANQGAWWARGDFNFDGAVNFDDLLLLARTYGSSRAAFFADWSLARSIAPEPAALLIVPSLIVASRRRRS